MWQRIYGEGREPPAQFYEQPSVPDYLRHYWTAFLELGSERQLGMGLGPIPRSKIKDYVADELGITDDDAMDRFYAVIRRIDDDYLAMANGASQSEETKPFLAKIDDPTSVIRVFDFVEARKKRELANKAKNPRTD